MKSSWLTALALAAIALTGASTTAQENRSERDPTDIGIEAYIYGYPLVTMEVTRRRDDQRGRAGRSSRPDGPVLAHAEIPRCLVQRRDCAECGHAVFDRLARPRQRVVRPEPPGHGRPLLPHADAQRLDRCVRSPREADDRHHGGRRTRSRDPTGKESCPKESRNSRRPPTWCGFSAGPAAPARPRTTRRATPSWTSTNWCRSVPMASRTPRPQARSILPST